MHHFCSGHRLPPNAIVLQQVQSESTGEFVKCVDLQSVAATAGQIARDSSPHEASLYLSASVTRTFLESPTGQDELDRADAACMALWEAARAKHGLSAGGDRLEYGWAMIRALHPNGPGPLCYWGRQENLPEATNEEQRAAFCFNPSSMPW